MNKIGPLYGVELIDLLPLAPGRPDAVLQQMPSRDDLYAICQEHSRVVGGYEVLTRHFQRLVELVRRIDKLEFLVRGEVVTRESNYLLLAVPSEDWAEMEAIVQCVNHPYRPLARRDGSYPGARQ